MMASVAAANAALLEAQKLLAAAHIADDDLVAVAAELTRVRNEQKQLDLRRKELEAKIYDTVGDKAAVLTAAGEVVLTITEQTRNSIDTKRLQAEEPAIAAQYMRSTTFKVLRVA